MRIVQIINSIDPSGGGPAETAKEINILFNQMGHQALILSLDRPDNSFGLDPRVRVNYLSPGYFKECYGFSPRLVPFIKKNIDQADCFIVHGIWRYCSFATWLALRGTGKPYVVLVHGMLDPWFRKKYPFKHFKKWLYWLCAEHRVLKDAGAVLFTCEEERFLAGKSFWPYQCHEVVINYGIASPKGEAPLQRRAFLDKFPQLEGKRLILFLGRIHPKKGCDLAIEALARFKNYKDLHLVIAGPDKGAWQGQLERRAKELGIENRVSWLGFLSGDFLWGAFNCAEVFILPSHQENFAISAVQAMSCQVPVLISDKVNIWKEIIKYGGGLVGEDNLMGTVNILEGWLNMTEREKALMRINAEKCFLECFRIEKTMQDLVTILGAL